MTTRTIHTRMPARPRTLASLLLAGLVVAAASAQDDPLERTETTRQTLHFEDRSGAGRLYIDNTCGSISVAGYDGDSVELVATRTTTAESDRRLHDAAEDVFLDVKRKGDRIEVVVDAPWRSRGDGYSNRGYRYYGYAVRYDFIVRIPRTAGLYVRTVEDGSVDVRDVSGPFDVRNVNGDVSMTGLTGHGRASTVNGSLEISFAQSPDDDCAFSTVNGKVDVAFPPSLTAEFVLKTFNGRAYTDFDIEPVERSAMRTTTRRGRTMFKLNDHYAVRVGSGGPTISFDTLNGDIHIKRHQ